MNLHPLRDQILSLACLPFHHARHGAVGKDATTPLKLKLGTYVLLSNTLENLLDRPVIDETGLTGRFDIFVSWDEPDEGHPDREGLKKALTEQLGIELVPDKRPLERLVVQDGTTH